MPDELLSSSEAAVVLGVSTTSVKRWADEGLLPCVKTAGKHRRFARATVEQFRNALAGLPSDQPRPADLAGRWLDALLTADNPQAVEAHLLMARSQYGSWGAVGDMLSDVVAQMGARVAEKLLTGADQHLAHERLQRGVDRMCEWQPAHSSGPRALLATVEGDDQTLEISLLDLTLRELAWAPQYAGRKTSNEVVLRKLAEPEHGLRIVALSASGSRVDAAALARQAVLVGEAARIAGVELLLHGPGAWADKPTHGRRLLRLLELTTLVD